MSEEIGPAPFGSTIIKLNVGLIIDSPFASEDVYDLAEWAQLRHDLSISHLIIQSGLDTRQPAIQKVISLLKRRGLLHILRQISFALITLFEAFILTRYLRHKTYNDDAYNDHFKTFDLRTLVRKSVTIDPLISKSGFIYRYSENDIQRIKALDLDVLIRCGIGILWGGILKSSRFGIVSIHHADNRINRGGQSGFWEVYFKQENTGFIIQQLTEELNSGNVLLRGCFPTKFFYHLNHAELQANSNAYLKKLLSDIAEFRRLPTFAKPQPYYNPLYKMPTLSEQINYIFKLVFRLADKSINRFLLKKRYRWGVAYLRSDWKTLVMWRAKKIKNPPNHFLADPFVIRETNVDYCFVEDYDYSAYKGCISVYKLSENNAERLGEAINEPFHMSFPYLFRFDSKIYMCPETNENKDIRIYALYNY